MRLIKVTFISEIRIGESSSALLRIYKNNKQYAFYTDNITIGVGDIIVNDAYNNPMLVMDIISGLPEVSRVVSELRKQGINIIMLTLVHDYIINGKHIYKGTNSITTKQESDMEEKRNIKVTLEQAMEWYNSGNSTLRTLALSAYTEDELKFNLKYINSKVCNTCFRISVPVNEAEKYNTLADLAIIAKFFNGSWKKTPHNIGYFIEYNEVEEKIDVCEYQAGISSGTIYFKNLEDAIKAVKILGKRVKSLFD